MEDIFDYWIELLGGEDQLQFVTLYTLQTLRRYCEGEKRSELEGETFQGLFFRSVNHGQDATLSEDFLFAGMPPDLYQPVYSRFVKMTTAKRALRSIQSLNTGTKNSLEHFYHVMEHVPYLYDPAARDGYKGGKSIHKRPRVEVSLRQKFGERGYYAIAFYCMANWRQMKTVSTFRPHEALGTTRDKEAMYLDQFKHQSWFQLLWCLIKQWKMPLTEFPKIELKLDSITSFAVCHLLV